MASLATNTLMTFKIWLFLSRGNYTSCSADCCASVWLLLGRLLTVSISTQVKQMQYGSVLTPSNTLSLQYHCVLMELMLFHRRQFEILGPIWTRAWQWMSMQKGCLQDVVPHFVFSEKQSHSSLTTPSLPWWCNSFWQNLIIATLCLQMSVAGLSIQDVLNAAARLISGSMTFEHITPVLKSLHWLKIPYRISYKISSL